jgi:hypothetical protein
MISELPQSIAQMHEERCPYMGAKTLQRFMNNDFQTGSGPHLTN